jgi:hypothetical protein
MERLNSLAARMAEYGAASGPRREWQQVTTSYFGYSQCFYRSRAREIAFFPHRQWMVLTTGHLSRSFLVPAGDHHFE